MSYVTIDDSVLTDIANVIRAKNGEETTYKPSEMAEAIVKPGEPILYKSILDRSIRVFIDKELTNVGFRTFHCCESLTMVDLHKATYIESEAFYRCTSLEAVILRSDTVCTCYKSWNRPKCFEQSSMDLRYGNGYFYVPKALLSAYLEEYSNSAFRFRAIEDYPEITGG